jgi:transcriptional regulator with XRE-family HTH domain
VRDRRRAHGLTQAQLALRAGTTQAALSRLERDELSPRFDSVARLLAALGEVPRLSATRPKHGVDAGHLAAQRARPPTERVELAMSWNRLAGEIARAGAAARRGEASPAARCPSTLRSSCAPSHAVAWGTWWSASNHVRGET